MQTLNSKKQNYISKFKMTRGDAKWAALVIGLLLLAVNVSEARYSGGSGEPNEPYRIGTAEDLNDISNHVEDYNKCFVMVNDIDLVDYTGTEFNIIGNDVNAFTGVFDGNGHTISNFTYTSTDRDYIGLFGYVGSEGEIRDLGIVDANIDTGSGYCVGGLCGRNYGSIRNCYSIATVSGGNSSSCVGGLIGYNYDGSISNCYSIGIINGYENVGGLCGRNYAGSIINCYADGSINGDDYIGGLCGYNYDGSITNCYAAGIVNQSDGYSIGGLCGRKNAGSISNSYFYMFSGPDNGLGTVLVESQPGKERFIGFDFAGDPNDGTDDDWAIVSGHCPKLTWQTDDGPLVPTPPATTLSGSGYSDDSFLINSESDFIEFYSNNNLTSGYYTLTTDIDLSGQTFNAAVINRTFSGHFEGSSNIISNIIIDTNGGNIDYLGLFRKIQGASAEVNNLGIIDCNIIGGEESIYVGGLCGSNSGRVNNCYSTGQVSGYSDVGGLIGSGYYVSNSFSNCTVSGQKYVGGFCGDSGGGIESCYTTGLVLGPDNAQSLGGFSGRNVGTISNCSATGNISVGNNSSRIGGFCGENTSTFTIINCYSTGAVTVGDNSSNIGGMCGDNEYGSVVNSFWDMNSSGLTTSDGGTGKTTTEMQTQSTFTDYGWDFVGETVNGPNDVWDICEGTNYPRLVWSIPQADLLCPDGVSGEDYAYFADVWNTADPNADFDLSGLVDPNDLKIFCDHWLEGAF